MPGSGALSFTNYKMTARSNPYLGQVLQLSEGGPSNQALLSNYTTAKRHLMLANSGMV